MPKTQYFGIYFNEYTLQVESQLTKDFIVLRNEYEKVGVEVIACCKYYELISPVLKPLQVKVIYNTLIPYQTALVYRVKENDDVELPDIVLSEVVERNVFVTKNEGGNGLLESNPENKGMYLKEQSRPFVSDINRMAYRPNALGPCDPAIKLLWG